MKTLVAELKANFDVFSNSWPDGLQAVMDGLKTKQSIFRDSYFRIASLQAWRTEHFAGYGRGLEVRITSGQSLAWSAWLADAQSNNDRFYVLQCLVILAPCFLYGCVAPG